MTFLKVASLDFSKKARYMFAFNSFHNDFPLFGQQQYCHYLQNDRFFSNYLTSPSA